MLPTGIVIQGGGGDPEKINPDQILPEHAEWFDGNLRGFYLAYRGRVHWVEMDLTLGDTARILYLQPAPELTPPDLANNNRLVPFDPFKG